MTLEQAAVIIFTALMGFLSGRAQTIANRHDEAEKLKDEQFRRILEQQKEFIEWQKDMTRQMGKMDRQISHISSCVERVRDGGLTLLRDRIIQSCRSFIERGSINLTARNNIREMYHCYHDEFGGNGDGEFYFNEMMGLPIDGDVPIVSHFDGGRHD